MAQDELRDANPTPGRDRLRQRLASHLAMVARPEVFESSESPANVFCKESSTGVSSRASKSRAAFSFFKAVFAAAGLVAGGGMEVEANVMFMRIVSSGRWSFAVRS